MSLLRTRYGLSRIYHHAVRRYGGRKLSSAVYADNGSDDFFGDDENLKFEIPHQSQPLGSPLPFDEHACSVSLPTWCSVVGYEEGDEKVTSAMNCGYPRFMYHPYVEQLMQVFLEKFSSDDAKEDCLVLPTKEAALRCQAFLQGALEKGTATTDNAVVERPEHEPTSEEREDGPQSSIRIEALEEAGVYGVLFPAGTAAEIEAKAYWQHTGELVSSRRAELALTILGHGLTDRMTCCPVEGTPTIYHTCEQGENYSPQDEDSVQSQLKERIAGWTNVPSENVFLLPSGMASLYKCLRSTRRYQMGNDPTSQGGKSIVFGFPYLDTLKLCSRAEFSPSGIEFFGKADATDLQNLEKVLSQNANTGTRWSALFTEVPSNPLLQCPDLEKLRELADEHDFCLVIDDTIGNFLNVDLIDSGLADAVCTSLTKLVSGRGDAMAGSVVCNPNTEKGRWMKQDMSKDTDVDGGLFEADASAVLYNSADFEERNDIVNENSEKLADFLNQHPDVETVWYPKLVSPLYSKYRKNGYGGVISMHLHPHICQRTFYDALDVPKGPSLGTNFTLVCPYTLLAHYHELDFALNYNVPPNLIRIAVGLEDYEELQEKFEYALEKSRLHPKINRPTRVLRQ